MVVHDVCRFISPFVFVQCAFIEPPLWEAESRLHEEAHVLISGTCEYMYMLRDKGVKAADGIEAANQMTCTQGVILD